MASFKEKFDVLMLELETAIRRQGVYDVASKSAVSSATVSGFVNGHNTTMNTVREIIHVLDEEAKRQAELLKAIVTYVEEVKEHHVSQS